MTAVVSTASLNINQVIKVEMLPRVYLRPTKPIML